MGSAIARQLKNNYEVLAYDKDNAKLKGFDGVRAVDSLPGLLKEADIVILAVKPQDFPAILPVIRADAGNKLFVSIAAGISTPYIESVLGRVRVVRVMPNMPAKIGEGMTCLAQGKFASLEDIDTAENLFDYLGETMIVEEDMMDQATAVSGSGPAYVCFFLESEGVGAADVPEDKKNAFLADFQKAALGLGFDKESASLLTKTTFNGTVAFLKREKISPAELRKQVTSKGGTTEAALAILSKGGSLTEAVKAAARRAEELSKGGS